MKRSDSILQKYYTGKLPKYQERPGTVLTYKNNPEWFDNRAVYWSKDPDWNDKVRKAVYSGNYGFNPETGAIVRLNPNQVTKVDPAIQEQSTAEWGRKTQQERLASNTPAGKAARKAAVASSMQEVFKNPITYVPGAVGAAIVAGPAAAAGLGSAFSAPLTIGSTIYPGVTMGNLLTSYGVAHAITNLPNTSRSLQQAFTTGSDKDIGEAATNVTLTGLDLLPVYGPVGRQLYRGASNFVRHPLVSSLPYAIRQGATKEYLQAATISGLNRLSPFLSTNPLTRGLYKKSAEKVASLGVNEYRSFPQIVKALTSAKPGSYRGLAPSNKEWEIANNITLDEYLNNRNLIRNYIYGDTQGFEVSDLPTSGLEKYYRRYGDLKKYKLDNSVLQNEGYPIESIMSQITGNSKLSPYADELNKIAEFDDQVNRLKEIIREKGTISFGSESNVSLGYDDIAGHMKFLSYDPATDAYKVKTQDIWKFTPEDYNKKWGFGLNQDEPFSPSRFDLKTFLDNYMKSKQASLMDKAGKPFILLDERPISMIRAPKKEFFNLQTNIGDYTPAELEELGIAPQVNFNLSDVINKPSSSIIKRQRGGPIVNQRGFMDGVPPKGSNWRIMGDGQGTAITMNLPNMPDEILVVPDGDFDQAKVMKRGDEDYFMGADFVDEYLLKDGGLTPNKAREILHDKEVHGKPLTEKQRRYFGAMSKGHTKKYMSGGGYGAFGYVPKMQIGGATDEQKRALAKRVVEIAKRRAKNNEWVPVPESIKAAAENLGEGAANCIGGVCTVLQEASVIPNVIWSNTEFARQAPNLGFNERNRGWGLKGIENLEPGDVVQWMNTSGKNPKKALPTHAQIYLGAAPDGKLLFFDNFNEEIRSYPKDKVESQLSWNRKPNEDQMQIYKVNPYTPPAASSRNPEAQKALEERQRNVEFQTDLSSNRLVDYAYQLRPESPFYGKKASEVPEGINQFFNKANDPEWISSLVEKVDKAGYGKRANREEIHDSLLNVFGILGVENKWDNPYIGGSYGVESLVERTTSPRNLSIGPGQIKYSQLSRGLRKAFNINRPQDLQDFNKVIPLMVGIDIANKQWMENQGERFSERIIGQPGLTSQQMIWDEGRISPYFYRGLGDKNIRKQLEREYGRKWYDTFLSDEMIQSRREGEDPVAREEFVRKNIRSRQKVLDPGSYGRKVFENIDKNIERKILYDNWWDRESSPENAIDLPEVIITGRRRPNMQTGGIFNTLPSNVALRLLPAFARFFKGDSKKAAAPKTNEGSVLDRFPAFINISDPRTVRKTTGQRINPNVDLVSGEYRTDLLTPALIEAKKQGLSKEDIWDMATIAFQESGWGKTDENIGHISGVLANGPSEDPFVNAYINKMKQADRLGMSDPSMRLQVYNGLGMIKPETEQDYHGFKMRKIYGVPVPKEGINMRKNPLYGKQIIDIRDNVLKKNPAVVDYINSIYEGNFQLGGNIAGMLRDYGTGISVPPKYQERPGTVKGRDYIEQWMNSPMYQQMLSASAQGPEFERINRGRISNLNIPVNVSTDINLYGTETLGQKQHRVRTMLNATVPEREEMIKILQTAVDNPKDKEARRKADQVIQPVVTGWNIGLNPNLKPGTLDYEAVLAHEYGHTTDDPFVSKLPNQMSKKELMSQDLSPYIPKSDIEKMQSYYQGKVNDDLSKYLSKPQETRQFLTSLRYLGKAQGVYDPFTEKITPEQYRRIKPTELNDPAGMLRKIYTDEQIIDMLNSISKTQQSSGIPKAQVGEEIPPYLLGPMGGDIQSRGPNLAYKARMDQAVREAREKREQEARTRTTIGPDTRTPAQKKRDAEATIARRKYEEEVLGKDFSMSSAEKARNREQAERIIHNLVDVPMTLVGAGELAYLGGRGLAAAAPKVGEYLTTQTPLKNTYRINPWRFKVDPEAYYHRSPNLENIINQETGMLQGFGESQAGKIFTESIAANIGKGLSLKRGANSRLYFAKGTPLDFGRTNMILDEKTGKMIPGQGYAGPYIVEVKDVPMGSSTKGRAPGAEPTKIGSYAVSKRPISVDEAKFYKEDWLRGYKEVPIMGKGGQHGGLDRWFAEKWVDIKTGKPCGRQEGENRAYPACRPSRRVSSKTPKTSSELSSAEREKFKRSKTSSERIPYSHKRRK